jgi:hypothetical protein
MAKTQIVESPYAKFSGILTLGDIEVPCYVLDTEARVINLTSVVKAVMQTDGGNLENYIGVNSLSPYIDKNSIINATIAFNIQGTQLKSKGLVAEQFLDVCRGYVEAWACGADLTERQIEIAKRSAVLLSSVAKVGLIALIDEATGYQLVRDNNALQIKLRAFIAEELRDWEETFPDALWEEFGRLANWKGSLHSRPKYWGKLVLELIYNALDPEIAKYLRETKPRPVHRKNYHQWFTEDFGVRSLIEHINQIIGIAKTCEHMDELREKVSHYYGGNPIQLTFDMGSAIPAQHIEPDDGERPKI